MMIISMHRFFKKNTKEGMGFFIVVLMLIGLVGIPNAFQKTVSDIWVIRVNDQDIDYKSYMRELLQYRELISSIKSMYGQLAQYLLNSMGLSSDPEKIAMEKLINQALLDQLAQKTGIVVSTEYVAAKSKDPVFMKNFFSHSVVDAQGNVDKAIMKRELAQQGMTVAEFEASFLQALARDFFLQLSEQIVYTPNFDTLYAHQSRHAARDLVLFELPFEFFLKQAQKSTITEEEAKSYFMMRNKVSRHYWTSEMRDGVVYRFPRSSYEVIVSEEEVQQYYDKNKIKQYVKDPAIITVEKITDVAVQNAFPDKSIQEIFSQLSDYEHLWEKVASFSRGTHEEAFERAAFALKKSGDTSSVIPLSDGTFVILRLVSLQPRTYKSFDSVKGDIKKELEVVAFKKQFMKDMNDAIKTGEIDNLLSKSGIAKTILKSASRENNALGISQLFSIKKEGTHQIFVENDSGYVVKLNHITPEADQDFSIVRDMVYKDIHRDRASKELKEVASSIGSRLAIEGLESILKTYKGNVVFEGSVMPSNESDMKKIEKFGLFSDLLASFDQKGMSQALKMDPSALFVYIRNINSSPGNDMSEESSDEISKFSQHRAAEQLTALVASFYRDATIDVNTLILDNVPEDLL